MNFLFSNKILIILASVFIIVLDLKSPLPAIAETDVFGIISENTTWSLEGSPYIIKSNVSVNNVLTIKPGVVVKFDYGKQLNIAGGGILSAEGTSNSYIIFTSLADDKYSGDTNKNSTATLPQPGDWDCIKFTNGGKGTLKYCIILYGGSGVTGNVFFYEDGGSDIQFCTIAYSKNIGVYIYGRSSPALGDAKSGGGRNDFFGNGTYALVNKSSNDIKAENNWWGSSAEIGVRNVIYDYSENSSYGKVDYDPWDTSQHSDLVSPIVGSVDLGNDCMISIEITDDRAVNLAATTVKVINSDTGEDITSILKRTYFNDATAKGTIAIGPLLEGCHNYEFIIDAKDQANNSSGETKRTLNNYCCNPIPICDHVDPSFGVPGDTIEIKIVGQNTQFVDNAQISFNNCPEISVTEGDTTVISPTEIISNITISNNAPQGNCDITINNGAESITCPDAFEVINSIPCSLSVNQSPITAGFLLPRMYFITVSATNFFFDDNSQIKIEDFRQWRIIKQNVSLEEMQVILIVPSRLFITKGMKTITVTTGTEVCTGTIEIN
jgi:hypothetical protein